MFIQNRFFRPERFPSVLSKAVFTYRQSMLHKELNCWGSLINQDVNNSEAVNYILLGLSLWLN
jgi:hypothetical protein